MATVLDVDSHHLQALGVIRVPLVPNEVHYLLLVNGAGNRTRTDTP